MLLPFYLVFFVLDRWVMGLTGFCGCSPLLAWWPVIVAQFLARVVLLRVVGG
jgi:hypothetical protein